MLLFAVAWSTSTGIRLFQEPPLVVIFGLMERNQSVTGFRLVIIISVIIISLKPIMLILEKFASTLPHENRGSRSKNKIQIHFFQKTKYSHFEGVIYGLIMKRQPLYCYEFGIRLHTTYRFL